MRKKRYLILFLMFSLFFSNTSIFAEKVEKDETIYTNLDYDGTAKESFVVNSFEVTSSGTYIDYGNYRTIKNLTNTLVPEIINNQVIWHFDQPIGRFYYQGELKQVELPYELKITYTLDGKPIEAEAIAGKAGRVSIELTIEENPLVPSAYRDNFMVQLTVPLNLNRFNQILADQAAIMITGKTMTLAYTHFGGSNTFKIEAHTSEFAMDSINLTMIRSDISSITDTEHLMDGFNEMSNGMNSLIEGTTELKEGTFELSTGIHKLSQGLKEIVLATPNLKTGFRRLSSGLNELVLNFSEIVLGSDKIKNGLNALDKNGEKISNGMEESINGLSMMLLSEEETSGIESLTAFANSQDFFQSQMGQLAQAFLQQQEGIRQLQAGLIHLDSGIKEYTLGVTALFEEYTNFHNGLEQIEIGLGAINNGTNELESGHNQVYTSLSQISNGLSEINEHTSNLPSNIDQLITGQETFSQGILEATNQLEVIIGNETDKTISSFIDPDNSSVTSVQFLMRTPAIKVPNLKTQEEPQKNTKKTIWQRFLDLFR